MTSTSASSRYDVVARGGWVGIAGNLVLGALKLTGGLLGRSQALLADAVDTLGDTVSSVVILWGAACARRPADPRHPYGHGKAEVLAGRTVAVIIIAAGLLFGYQAVGKVVHPQRAAVPALWTVWFAVVSILGKEAMARYKFRLARRVRSESLVADAWNHRSDVLTSVLAAAGITGANYLGPAWRVLDPLAAAVICVVILWVGLSAYRRTGSALMDEAADDRTQAAIRGAAHGVEGVEGTEKLFTRRSGLEIHAELHVEVDPAMPVSRAHQIATRVREAVQREVPDVTHVTVHIEPHEPKGGGEGESDGVSEGGEVTK